MGAGISGLFHNTYGAKRKTTGISQIKGVCSQLNNISMSYYSNIVTPIEKFVEYSLNYNNPNAKGKAEAYEKGLGYTKVNARDLQIKIHNAISSGYVKPYNSSETEYGTKYKFRISITGPNGNIKNVIVVYQIDKGSTIPRLITNYVEAKK